MIDVPVTFVAYRSGGCSPIEGASSKGRVPLDSTPQHSMKPELPRKTYAEMRTVVSWPLGYLEATCFKNKINGGDREEKPNAKRMPPP